MVIFLNGKQVETDCSNLKHLVFDQHLETDSLVIEINGTVIPEKLWRTHPVCAGDRIEFLHFVGGG
jgi:thiamine biosynthesis protein ThiS